MKKMLAGRCWGVILIIAGCIALAQTQGLLGPVQSLAWMEGLAGVGVFSLVFYFLD